MEYGKLIEVVEPEGTPLAAEARFLAHVPGERNRDGAPRSAARTVREDGLASSHDCAGRGGTVDRSPMPTPTPPRPGARP
ncbi:hypothetical protein [Streptomyces buecherae]|uniref:hypothetical protein n=1 Tax=Streptomyces buecherae TaxID=2763006 RepID=UPI0036A81E76